jgi:Tfp pilus assembly protein PilN
MEAVNLLPAYARPASRWSSLGKELSPARVIKLGGVVAAACVIAVAGLYFYERAVVNDRHAKLTDATARLTAVEATAAPLRAAQAASSARESVVRTVSDSRVAWEAVLRDFSLVLPDQVYLQSLQAQSPTAVVAAPTGVSTTTSTSSPGTVPTSFTISGVADSLVRVALVLDRLALLPWLSNVTLQSSTHGTGGGASAGDQFSITAGFSAPAPTGGAR